jgi:glutathione reductase (NADPH)
VTNIDNIFALGDATGRAPLTPVAIAAGRRLSDRLYLYYLFIHCGTS